MIGRASTTHDRMARAARRSYLIETREAGARMQAVGSMRQLIALAVVALFGAVTAPAQGPSRNAGTATILQINDVYELTPVDGLGGLARVATLKKNIARGGSEPILVI